MSGIILSVGESLVYILCSSKLSYIVWSVVILSVIIQRIVMLSVIIRSDIMLIVVILRIKILGSNMLSSRVSSC